MRDGGGTRAFLRFIWRWSWFVTLPAAVAFCLWAADTASMYYFLKIRHSPTMTVRLSGVGAMQARLMANEALGSVTSKWNTGAERLEAVHIFARESELKKLDSNLPYSGEEYVEAALMYPDGEVHKVKMRYRGDFSYHWAGKKKSIRIKTRKGRLYKGMRSFNLIIPKTSSIVPDHLSYLLARRLALPVPESGFVEVYINGRYSGVHLLAEQPGEQLLRRNSLMPGDLYVGELVGRDSFSGVPNEVFLNPAYWTKASVNDHNPPEWNEALKSLSSAVYTEDMDALLDIIDLDAWARFAAHITISMTAHYDNEHNWRLYFDPAMGAFVPVVWDPMGWHYGRYVKWLSKQTNPRDVVTNIIFERLHRDQRFLKAKQSAVEEFFAGGGEEFLMEAASETARLEASIKRDANLHFDSTFVLSPREVAREVRAFRDRLKKSLSEIRDAYLNTPPLASYSVKGETVQVNVEGFTTVKYLEVEFSSPVKRPEGVKISFMADGREESRDVTHLAKSEGRTLRVNVPLFSRRVMTAPKTDDLDIIRDAEVRGASYFLHIGGEGKNTITGIRAGYGVDRVSELERVDSLEVHPLDRTFHVIPVEGPRKALEWSGEVVVKGIREIDGDLVLRPGTTVRLSPGSLLMVRGRLEARGEKGKPVRFLREKPGYGPWGAVVLSGAGADGSVLRGCEFSGGSGAVHRFVEYSAMLSIHGVRNVEIADCAFSDNSVVDDMVHAVYSEVTVRASEFTGANSDAVDFDYVRGKIINSRFSGSGNDALDLMSSQVVVAGSSMKGSGDKGISVGEGTDVLVWNTLIAENQIGVQAKDGSRAVLYNVELSGNARTIDAYKKNWQYGDGGHALVLKSRLAGASAAITADKDSSVKIYDSFLDAEVGKEKSVYLDSTVDSASVDRAATDDTFSDRVELPEFFTPYIELMDPKVRGAVGGSGRAGVWP